MARVSLLWAWLWAWLQTRAKEHIILCLGCWFHIQC